MSDTIRVLIVDDLSETRENVRKLLQFESDMEVIGQAATGLEAVEMAQEHQPDIILMDINMPGIDGIGASQKISELVPRAQIIIMSVQSDSDYLRRAMLAGARDFLTKPFGGDELVAAIRRVHEKRPVIRTGPLRAQRVFQDAEDEQAPALREGHVIAVFSPKGGSGCTTIAINMAVSMAKRGYRTVLVDGSLQFGDVAVMLNMKPTSTIIDLSERASELDMDLVSSVVQVHKSGVNVLLAPPRPEMADVVTEEHFKSLFSTLRQLYDFIIVDTSSSLNDVALLLLDTADRIVLVAQQSLPSLKNISRFFDLAESLHYEQQKVWLIVNRVSKNHGIGVKDISDTLKRPVVMAIPAEDDVVNAAVDRGVPLVIGSTQKRPVSLALNKLADFVVQELAEKKKDSSGSKNRTATESESVGIFGRLFGRRVKAGG